MYKILYNFSLFEIKIFIFLGCFINPLASLGEEVSVFTYLYLSAGAPALGEAKGLMLVFFCGI